jgi:hypothetical protein
MLLTYNEYNKDLGYVQGMSDLLAPIYAVMQDDAIAFWGFVGFMERMVCDTERPLTCRTATNVDGIGAKLPARPVWHAQATHDARSSRTTHGP